MCTLTWFVSANGYDLFFNRDESVARQRAIPPSHQEKEGIGYIAPIDADAGGTWIAVNQHGITVCLLNHYQYQQLETYKDWVSRGEIVRQFATTSGLREVEHDFFKLQFDDFRAFRMFVIEPSGKNGLFVWDGHTARIEAQVDSPKSSSAVDSMHVKQLRRQLFKDQALSSSTSVDRYIAYHRSHTPTKSLESVCMHRPEAKTVSLTHVKVSDTQASVYYADGAPCEAKLSAAISLPLARSGASDENPRTHVASI